MVTKPMESPPSSRISFYDQSGVIPVPIEGRICGIAIDVPKALRSSISLMLSGHLLSIGENETIAYSEWPPCGPGHYELFLVCDHIREQRSVTVMPQYFTESDVTFMIRDLTEAMPHTIASQLNACGAKLGILPARDQKSSIEDEYLKLRNAISGTKEKLGMLQILPILQRNCHQVLLPQLELRSVSKVRRPDISKLPQAISIPGNVLTSERLYQMFDVTVERSYEAYENRLVKAYALALRSRLSRLQAKVKSEHAPPAMASELDALANEFHLAYVRATYLREVKSSSVSSVRVTMVLLKNPAYRAVLEGYLALNEQSSVTLDEPALYYPLNNFPYLYQRWVNLKVLSALLQVCAEFGYRCVSHDWVTSNRRSTVLKVMHDGQPAVQLSSAKSGRLVSFIPWSPGETKYVVGKEPMRAAITIETTGKPTSLLLFDPKYWVDSKIKTEEKSRTKTNALENKVSKTVVAPLKEDVDDIHRFIDQVKASNATNDIQFSALLYPGPKKQLASGIEALPAHPNDADGLQKTIRDVIMRYLA